MYVVGISISYRIESPGSIRTLADGGGQESAASDRDLGPRSTGEEGALHFALVEDHNKQMVLNQYAPRPEETETSSWLRV